MLERALRAGGRGQERQHRRVVAEVGALGPATAALTDAEMREAVQRLRSRVQGGEDLGSVQAESFALVREAAGRVLGQRPYDVQVYGASVLHAGGIAEMRTGEGKTLTSTMPVLLNALAGKGVHVVTVNEYLAQRDAEWMGSIHRFLGLTVGVTLAGDDIRTRILRAVADGDIHPDEAERTIELQIAEAKRAAYAADITYGTSSEFGFDHLRDNMAARLDLQVQRGRNMALIDEIDSILIDEARTPLVISGADTSAGELYATFAAQVVPNLRRGRAGLQPGEEEGDYLVDETRRTVSLTEEGISKVERILGVEDLYTTGTPFAHHLQVALKALELYRRDREYVVSDGEVMIVDPHTGRALQGRRYSDGLHQAIEAKEGVLVNAENRTLATVTLQNYYRGYTKLAGMTGTAQSEESEFSEVYGLRVVPVPPNRPTIREDHPDVIYKTRSAKFSAVVSEISTLHRQGRPVLAGTTSVEESELLSRMLAEQGISHEVLNAKNHAKEAEIVAQAGRLGAVTVATNMAGRGTDIILGGSSGHTRRASGGAGGPGTDATERDSGSESEKVRELGGLFVIGTARHESRRIDDQLRGRAGRQGDPGASRFYLSLEDDLMRLFNAGAVEKAMRRMNLPDDTAIEADIVTRAVAGAQRQVESVNFDQRKNLLKYDEVLEEQRRTVFRQRQTLLEGDDELLERAIRKQIEDVATETVLRHCPHASVPEEWDLDGLASDLQGLCGDTVTISDIDPDRITVEEILQGVTAALEAVRARAHQAADPLQAREAERGLLVHSIDELWREHLHEMSALREGIGLRAVGQRDPLTEYRREAHEALSRISEEVRRATVAAILTRTRQLEPAGQ